MKTAGRNHIRILLVDDEEDILELYQKVLQEPTRARSPNRMGQLAAQLFGRKTDDEPDELRFDLTFARQANDALRQIEKSLRENAPFALMFLDIRMPPGADGIWAAEHIRKIDPHIEIILVTGFSDIDPREIGRRVPPIDKLLYLEKPFMPQEIRHFASSIGIKWQTERDLRHIHEDLEQAIKDRTQELETINQRLLDQVNMQSQAKQFQAYRGEILEQIASGAKVTQVAAAIADGIQSFRSDLVCVLLLPSKDAKRLILQPIAILPDYFKELLQPPIQKNGNCFSQAAWTKQSVYLENINNEITLDPFLRKASSDGFLRCLASPIAGESGLLGVLGVFTSDEAPFSPFDLHLIDASVQLLAIALDQHKVKSHLEQLMSAVEQNPTALMIAATDGNIEYVNPACIKLTGLPLKDLIGQDVDNVLGVDHAELIPQRRAALAQQQRWEAELEQVRPTGERFYERVIVSPIIADRGQLTHILVIREDISEHKQAQIERQQLESRLLQAQKMETIGTLAGGIAHDFNNMLTPILGYVEMAMAELPKEGEVAGFLTNVMRASGRARELVQQMLTFSRRNQSERESVNLYLVVDEAVKLVRANLPASIRLKLHLDEHCGMVKANPTQLIQALFNLCTNAKHAMRVEGGVLTISLRKVNRQLIEGTDLTDLDAEWYAAIEVADTGHGMSNPVLNRIFEPFFTTKGTGEGTGLGLSVVHGTVLSHRGEIQVTTEEDVGSRFTIYLPLYYPPSGQKSEPKEPKRYEHILFVDDEEMIVHMTKGMLERQGYQVTAFSDPQLAYEAFLKDPSPYQILITDQTMPHMSGADLAQRVRAVREDLPIILLTGFSELVDEENCLVLGIREFLMKPMSSVELVQAIRKVLDP